MFHTKVSVGLAEWIIDDYCLLSIVSNDTKVVVTRKGVINDP